MSAVLDPASGSRMFYFDRDDSRVVFGDIRSESHVLCDGRALDVAPAVVMDFRGLPFADGQFKVVIFDPPHLTRVGRRGWMFKKYGGLDVTTWREDLAAGFAECFRVLAADGVLIFKWNETQIPVSEVLALTPHKPLVGHPRVGKSATTHWVTFIKESRMTAANKNLPCPVCKGRKSHHKDCSVPVLGPPQTCTCNPAEVDQGICVLCGRPFPVGGAV